MLELNIDMQSAIDAIERLEKVVKNNSFTLRLKPSLFNEARQAAEAEGLPLSQLINAAVAEKLSALRTEKYVAERGGRASIPKTLDILKRAGVGNRPAKGDRLRRGGK